MIPNDKGPGKQQKSNRQNPEQQTPDGETEKTETDIKPQNQDQKQKNESGLNQISNTGLNDSSGERSLNGEDLDLDSLFML